MMKKYLPLLLLMLTLLGLKPMQAQNPVSLYYMENIPQSMLLNPALMPRANGYFGFPAINNVYTSFRTDLSIDDFFQKSGGNTLTPFDREFDFGTFYRHIGDAANIDISQTISPLMMGWRTKHGYFNFGITAKAQANVSIPRDLFSIADVGFPDGKTFDFSPLGINLKYYNEVSLGYALDVTSDLAVGVTAKALFGIASVHTDIETMDFTTGVDEWRMEMDGVIYSSVPGLNVTPDENGVPGDFELGDLGLMEVLDKAAFNVNNPGFALDLGAVYNLDDYWKFSASVTDLGFITWKKDLNSIHFNGEYAWEGLQIDGTNGLDSIDVLLEQTLDTLKNSFAMRTATNDSYTTYLGPKMYLGATYNVNHYFNLGFLSKTTFAKNNFQQEFNLSANLNLYHFLSTTVNYSVALDGRNNFGFGLGLRAGPFQFFTLMDYIPYSYKYYSFQNSDGESRQIAPDNFQAFNIMFGLNLIFGANGYKDEPMIDDYVEF